MIICDLDWTLADCDHRKKFLLKEIADRKICQDGCGFYINGSCDMRNDCSNVIISKESWNEFFREDRVFEDIPVVYSQEILFCLNLRHRIVYFSGRFERLRAVTLLWLEANGYPFSKFPVYLRKNEDFRTGFEVKIEFLEQIKHDFPLEKKIIIDDDSRFSEWAYDNDFIFFLADGQFWRNAFSLKKLL